MLNVLRNSGCNSICINRKFVTDDQITGEYKICRLIDGSEIKVKMAVVDIDTSFLAMQGATVVCLENFTFDLVIGNVEGATCGCSPSKEWNTDDVVIAQQPYKP